MHAGNIFSALLAWLGAKSQGGSVVLRIEDLDEGRSRAVYVDQILKDFENLGLTWDIGPIYQSLRLEVYQEAFQRLNGAGLVYPCFCTRAERAASRAPHAGDRSVYDGRCRHGDAKREAQARAQGRRPAWRLRVCDLTLAVDDLLQGRYVQNLERQCGDFIVKRSDGGFAYQLASVIDDAEEGVNLVVRGCDLLSSTPQQIYLQRLLTPSLDVAPISYAHGPLLVEAQGGRRLAKRDRDASLEEMLHRFKSPEAVIGHIAALTGLTEKDEPIRPADLLKDFSFGRLKRRLKDRQAIVWR